MNWIICCGHSASFLPNLVDFSKTGVIFGGGRRAGGAWAVSMVVSGVESNPVQTLKVEQQDMVSVVDCFTQLFSMGVNFYTSP